MSIEIKNVVVVEHEKEGALYADITAPLYWWNEFDVLNIGRTVKCDSIWSRITAKELSLKDFSCEYARKFGWSHDALTETIRAVNAYAKGYLTAKTEWVKREDMLIAIQLLPCSYNQKRTVIMDYKTLIDINLERES